jgi:hypothetical protein
MTAGGKWLQLKRTVILWTLRIGAHVGVGGGASAAAHQSWRGARGGIGGRIEAAKIVLEKLYMTVAWPLSNPLTGWTA